MFTAPRLRLFLICIAAAIAATCIAACGGGSSSQVVAKVGDTPITKAEINHWMSTLAGGDYYEVSRKHLIPAGLVSDPANYLGCVSNLEAAIDKRGASQAKPSASQLLSKCQQLNRAIKQQATAYLVEAQWIIGLAGEEGVKASDADIKTLFDRIKKEEYSSERKFKQFLANNRRSLADELLVVKLDVLRDKLTKKAQEGGNQALIALTEDGQRWTAKTTCEPGYVVPHCKQYKGNSPPTPHQASAAVLLEQVAAITGATPCVNRAACA